MSTTTPPPREGYTGVANPEPPTEAAPEHLAGADLPREAGRPPGDMNRPLMRDKNRKKKRNADDDDDHRVIDRNKKRDMDDDDDDHLRPDDDRLRPDDHRDTKSKRKRARDDDDDHDNGDPVGAPGGVTVTPSPGGGPTVRDSDETVRDHRGPDALPPRADGGPTVRDHRSDVRSAPVNPEPDPIVRDQGDAAPAPDGSAPTVPDHGMRDFDDVLGEGIQEMPAASVPGGIGDPGDMTPVGNAQMDNDDWDTQSVTAASDTDGPHDADAYAFGSDAADADESTTFTPDDGDQAIGDAEMPEQLD